LPTAVILLNHEGDTAMIALPLNLTELLEVVQSGNLVKVFMESGFTVSYDDYLYNSEFAPHPLNTHP
jgi:hypothetical protein